MGPIVQTEDREEFGLKLRYVFGLNIFAANGVDAPASDDPRVIFLRTLSEQHPCSAHTGNLYDLADDPEELFGGDARGGFLKEVRVGVNGGTFYDAADWPTFPACFFPEVRDSFWLAHTPERDADIVDVLRLDALALYVEPEQGASGRMESLLAQPIPGHEGWLQSVTNLYRLVILTGGDGWDFAVYTQDARHFDLLSPALAEAVKAVEVSQWYQQHSERLRWDDEYGGCLRLPEHTPKHAV